MGAKAKHDIAPLIRNAFSEGIGIVARKKGMTIPELMAEWIEESPLQVLQAVSKFTVREANVSGKVEHEHSGNVTVLQETTQRLVDDITGRTEASDAEVSRSH